MHQAKILSNQGMKQYRIAEVLGVSDRTIRNYLSGRTPSTKIKKIRASKLDPYKPFITSILKDDPLFNCEILLRKIRARGYEGGVTILRDLAAKSRNEIQKEVVVRFETEAGYQAQMDWKILSGEHWKGIYAFVMILGYSRTPFVYFTNDMTSGTLLQCHKLAFRRFGGVPETVLYDNMKTAWIYREDQWHPNNRLLEMASFYGFSPKRCAVRRPETKGKVERFIGYLASDFLTEAKLDGLKTASELNYRVPQWLEMVGEKKLRDFCESREERFQREQQFLQCLPFPDTYDPRDSHELLVSREGSITFKTNKYSVPPEYVGRMLILKIDAINNLGELFFDGNSIRSFDLMPKGAKQKRNLVEDEIDLLKLWEQQRKIVNTRNRKQKHNQKSSTIVQIRQTSYYDNLIADGGLF
jgi:transposase